MHCSCSRYSKRCLTHFMAPGTHARQARERHEGPGSDIVMAEADRKGKWFFPFAILRGSLLANHHDPGHEQADLRHHLQCLVRKRRIERAQALTGPDIGTELGLQSSLHVDVSEDAKTFDLQRVDDPLPAGVQKNLGSCMKSIHGSSLDASLTRR